VAVTPTRTEAELHLHADEDVTAARVDAFANANRDTQLAVLAELNRRTTDDTLGLQLTITIAVFGLLAVLSPGRSLSDDLSWLERGITVGLVVITILAVMIGPSLSSLRQNKARVRAHVWADAYRTELDRRWADQTRTGRRWQTRRMGRRCSS
jgi:hypothetical protein